MKPEITRQGIFDMQVCVPKDWTDKQVINFANSENPSGLSHGWRIKKEGHEDLKGDPERVQCDQRQEFVHIMLEV